MYAPFGPYGVTPIHAGHPGTVTLRRETFEALLTDDPAAFDRARVEAALRGDGRPRAADRHGPRTG